LVRNDFLVDARGVNKVNGLPFRRIDIELAIVSHLDALAAPKGTGQGPGPRTSAGNGHSKEQI
jgi:hypothetical protein